MTLLAAQPDCLWDGALPVAVKELADDVAACDEGTTLFSIYPKGRTLSGLVKLRAVEERTSDEWDGQ